MLCTVGKEPKMPFSSSFFKGMGYVIASQANNFRPSQGAGVKVSKRKYKKTVISTFNNT